MKVFISWSGEQSNTVAKSLFDWLPDVVQRVVPWMSEVSLDAGTRWSPEIDAHLDETSFGIVCLTASNLQSPWIQFEAGAIAKRVKESLLCPYLIGIEPFEVPSNNPLSRFQAKVADEKGTWDLVKSINQALGEERMETDRLRRCFDRSWPALKQTIENAAPEETGDEQAPLDQDRILVDVLNEIRSLSRAVRNMESTHQNQNARILSAALHNDSLRGKNVSIPISIDDEIIDIISKRDISITLDEILLSLSKSGRNADRKYVLSRLKDLSDLGIVMYYDDVNGLGWKLVPK